jgi:hypothetical protein
MGTSVEILQKYYGKSATSAKFATGLGDQHAQTKNLQDLIFVCYCAFLDDWNHQSC